MAQTASTMMLPLGATAPSFELPDPSGRTFSLAGFDGSAGLLVAFICKHCPFVKHVRVGFASLAAEYVYRGQMDGSRPGNDVPVSGADLRAALDASREADQGESAAAKSSYLKRSHR